MYKRLFFYLFYPLAFLLFVTVAKAQQSNWQWSVRVNHTQHEQVPSRAHLWVPADCKKIRAVIFAQNNMEEQSILENAIFRKAMARLGVAEIWVSPAYDLMFNFDKGAGEIFNAIMNDLAEISGYTELRYVPFIGMGHSAAASAPYYMAAWNPERALAAISVSGQWPYFRHPSFAPDIWGKRTIDFIPCLETMGEYEAANTWSAEGLRERQQHPLMPLSMLASPAQGHFAATDAKCAYIALYIKKAIQYRIPAHVPDDAAPKLIPLDPTKSGWLVDKWRYDQKPEAPAGQVGQYSGDRQQAFWFFDEEIARATIKYEATNRFQKPELIGYVQDGEMVAQYNTHQQVNLKFEPEDDGITFKLHAAFYDTVGGGSPRLAMWANMPVGSAIGHSTDGGPIVIDRITGPVIKVNDSTFRLNLQQGFWQDPHSYELWFAAIHPGDERYKPAVQQAQMLVLPRNKDGREQHITFLPVADQKPGAKNIKLQAVSDAKVPVSFYVQDGPAVIHGDTLDLTAMPPKSKFPVKVTVVAWQYGNSNQPKLQTAEPVERVFWINK